MNVPQLFRSIWARLNVGGLAFTDTIATSIDRENVRFILPEDSRLYVTEWVRQRINEKSEWLWQNFPIVKEMGEGIGRHTIGKGISLQVETEDQEWNVLAERDFENWALTPARCDVSARRNFYEAQLSAVEQFIFRGEYLSSFVGNPRWPAPSSSDLPGAPSFWMVDSNDCRTPLNAQDPTLYGRVVDGIELGNYGEPVNYYVRTTGQLDYVPVPASEMCHWYKPHAVNQVRGISPLAQAVNPLVDVHELRRLTTRSAKAQQMVSMVLKNIGKSKGRGALGAIKSGAGTDPTTGACDVTDIEKMGRANGAAIAYVDADGDVKMVSSNAPSPLVEPFVRDLLMRDACLAPGVPMEFFWDPSKLSGANTRFVLGRADLFFQILADGLIYRWCTPMAVRVLAWRIQAGLLRPCKDLLWMEKLSWQLPARLTVDNGREGALDLQKLRAGMLSLRAYYNARGMNWRTELLQRVRELAELKRMCSEAGMPEIFQYFVALDPGAQLIQNKSQETENKDPDETSEIDTQKDDQQDDKKAA